MGSYMIAQRSKFGIPTLACLAPSGVRTRWREQLEAMTRTRHRFYLTPPHAYISKKIAAWDQQSLFDSALVPLGTRNLNVAIPPPVAPSMYKLGRQRGQLGS